MGNHIIFLELGRNKMKLLPVCVKNQYFGIDISGIGFLDQHECGFESSDLEKQGKSADTDLNRSCNLVSDLCGYAGQF